MKTARNLTQLFDGDRELIAAFQGDGHAARRLIEGDFRFEAGFEHGEHFLFELSFRNELLLWFHDGSSRGLVYHHYTRRKQSIDGTFCLILSNRAENAAEKCQNSRKFLFFPHFLRLTARPFSAIIEM